MYPVSKGWSTVIGWATAALSFLALIIAQLSDTASLFGVNPETYAKVGAALAILVFLGRALQAMRGSIPVKWGIGSTVTFSMAVASALLLILGEANESFLLFLSPDQMAKLTGWLTGALVVGRMIQAAFGDALAEFPLDEEVDQPVLVADGG